MAENHPACRSSLLEWQKFLLSESHVLRVNPTLLFQQAVNRPEAEAPARMAEVWWAAGRERRPFCRRINKPARSSAALLTLTGHIGPYCAAGFSPDGTRIFSASYYGTVTIWDATSGAECASLSGHQGRVNACAFSPDGIRIVSASLDGTLRLWDAASGRLLRVLSGHADEVSTCAFSPDGRQIISASRNGSCKRWDADTGESVHSFACDNSDLHLCCRRMEPGCLP